MAVLAVVVHASPGGARVRPRPAEASAPALAPTVSGYTSAPVTDRSARVSEGGIGIRFRAPVTGSLAVLHTYWRVASDGCQAFLQEDADGAPGAIVAAVPVPADGAGWLATRLDAPVTADAVYHAVLRCTAPATARLGYVLDADDSARDAGAWQLEDLRGARPRLRRRPASPLFAVVFADGRWWGAPYHAMRGRSVLRIGAGNEVRATVVPTRPLAVAGVRVPRAGSGAGLVFSLAAADGVMLLAGSAAGDPASTALRAAATAPVTLTPGVPYTLRVFGTSSGTVLRQRALATDLPLGAALGGLDFGGLELSDDRGRTWRRAAASALALGLVQSDAPAPACGDGTVDPGEECDGAADTACPGRCTAACTCAPETATSTTSTTTSTTAAPPTTVPATTSTTDPTSTTITSTTASTATTTVPPTTSTTMPGTTYRSIYPDGYFGVYDGNTGPTVSEWPRRMGFIQGSADGQGPLVANAKALAQSSGNGSARFIFYSSLTSLDITGGFDARFYNSFIGSHPEWILHDASGNRVWTFVPQLGTGVQIAVDIGNPAFVDAWGAWALAAMDQYGWDGVFADNVEVTDFYGWSPYPVNPRTGARYTVADYRRDLLAALQRLRARFDPRGKILIGNHADGWVQFGDPVVQQMITAMHGVRIENCVFNWDTTPLSETRWISQLNYFAFANQHGVITQCQGVGGTINGSGTRDYVLATALLTKEGYSGIAELNRVSAWWSNLDIDLGAPRGGYVCLDPAAGLAVTSSCPTTGKIYSRDWQRGRVLVNPSATATVTVPLGETLLLYGSPVSSVTLAPHSGAVLARP
jgi:hypothetical protein